MPIKRRISRLRARGRDLGVAGLCDIDGYSFGGERGIYG
tara:strand:+ start:863 stop:979 length:117 start_codon:yes stop_codon:yes gene_type:complete